MTYAHPEVNDTTAQDEPPRNALIVANPAAGTTRTELVEEVVETCRERLGRTTVHVTTCRGDATGAVREALRGKGREKAPDLVVAIGGDGTVHEVVEGMVPGRRPATAALAIVPAGTGNSGYRMLWGDRPWRESLGAVLGGPAGGARKRRLDLAALAETGGLVFLGACSGVIAQALETARGIPLTGRPRYERAFARTAASFIPYPGRVTVDGALLHEGDTVLANIGGGRFRGGQYLVLPHSLPDDGLLDICVIGAEVHPREVPGLTLTGGHLDRPGVVYSRGRRITVERLDGAPLCFEHDGELQRGDWRTMTLDVLPGMIPAWGPRSEERTAAA
ncbi:diacylglycerol/lipid kinase family protein [Streptomyces mangrovi]|uniref:diacylglycerol/lipid kinase family protein n=1 Tax=Streptomyces mangrovi TaxID=1206892 RepID=UPI00399D4BC6